MKTETEPQEQQLPSKKKVAKATAIALLVAVGLLVTTVLPAEYGIDPLGTGAALGLTVFTEPFLTAEELAPPGSVTPFIPVQQGPIDHYTGEYKFDSVEFELGPYEYVEYKYRLEDGASMLFSWMAGSDLIHDFHGEPDGSEPNYSESFDKANRRQGNGVFTAPFPGIHGWYWENPGGETITVRLTTTGFYSSALELRFDRTRQAHELTALETIAVPRKANVTTVP